MAFVAGLAGGAHCLGMCGGFVIAAAAGGQRGWLFHAGRLAGYALLGAAAGIVGSALDLGGSAVGLHRLRFIASGALLVAFGLAFLGAVPRRWLEPGGGLATRAIARLRGRGGRLSPLFLGLPIGLLPCGLLLPMYVAAAGTASWTRGATLLVAFGCGTVPLLGALSFALERLGLPARRRLVAAAGLVMLGLGGSMLVRGVESGAGTEHRSGAPHRMHAPAR